MGKNNINSFTQTVENLTQNVNIALASMQNMNESLTTQKDTITYEFLTEDEVTKEKKIETYSMPSYQYTINELNRIKNTVDELIAGNGVVLLDDGTYRRVMTIPLAKSPNPITGIVKPTQFSSKNNWFFEDLIFPKILVDFDLKGYIDDRSDRVQVKRIIFDNKDQDETQWFIDNFVDQEYSYEEVINLLSSNNKKYWLDDELLDLPLNPTKYTGSFIVLDINIIDNKKWWYLDTLNYGETSDFEVVKNIEIKIGDQLRLNETLYKVLEVESSEKRVHLIAIIGTALPKINDTLNIYSTPFNKKIVSIPVGYNECNILFLKGVNDDFNIIGDQWGTSISFYTNNLVYSENNSIDLESFYFKYVSDFGRQLESQAKDKIVPAIDAVKPDAPSLKSDFFKVEQVNKQLNASLDTEEIKTTQTQIESTKSIINSLKTTIAQQKAELVELTDPGQRNDLQDKIDSNISQLSKKTVEYQSLVKSLATLAYENNAVFGNPKYRVRGFFPIPLGKTTTNNPDEQPQEIIQFELQYRYLRLDNTGNPLNTYTYVDPSTNQKVTGTYTDWVTVISPIRNKKWDEVQDKYVWEEENIGDGEIININQIDIPITKGEKVEFRVKSISEAGWPNTLTKSEWSDSVIMDFPPNLVGSDQVADILSDAISEESDIKLNETLNSTGVITHLQDGYPNPNAGSGTYFKHQSRYLSYDQKTKDIEGGITKERSVDLQTFLDTFGDNFYITVKDPASTDTKTVTLNEMFRALMHNVSGLYGDLQNP